MKQTQRTKYHVSLPQKAGVWVVADQPEDAVRALFPEATFTIQSSGRNWVRFQSSKGFPKEWPQNSTGTGGGTILDVEDRGNILVVG